MRTAIVGRVIPVALAFVAILTLTGNAFAWPGNIGGKIAKATKAAVKAGNAQKQVTVTETTGETAGAGEVTLKLEGESAVAFDGTCAVGEEEKVVDGWVPKSYTFDLDGRRLECEIHKQDPGALEIILSAEGTRSVHRTSGGESTVKMTYEDGSVSSSTISSSGSSVSTSQTTSSSSSVVSSSSVRSGS